MTAIGEIRPRAGHKAIRLDADGIARLEGVTCGECGAIFSGAAMACRACGSRASLQSFRAAQTGKVFSWSVIHRSYPGVAVPFVSAIVDLDGGLTLKGTLREVAVEAMHVGMPVEVVFDDAGGARDGEGAAYIGFHFVSQGAMP